MMSIRHFRSRPLRTSRGPLRRTPSWAVLSRLQLSRPARSRHRFSLPLLSSALFSVCVMALCGLLPPGMAPGAFISPAGAVTCSPSTPCYGAGVSHGGLDIWAGIRYPSRPGVPGNPATPGSDGYEGPFRFGIDPHPIYVGDVTPAVCALFQVLPWYCPRPGEPATPDQPDVPELSLNDLRRFVPENPTIATQPAGWTVAGLHTNMLAGARRHVINGTVLGWPVEVAFRPVAYRWSFGDGSSGVTSSAGTTWQTGGVREFARTATSHVYPKPGTYTAWVEAVYDVSYRFSGFSWNEVAGQVASPSGPATLVVGRFDRALVGSSCVVLSRAPGCPSARD